MLNILLASIKLRILIGQYLMRLRGKLDEMVWSTFTVAADIISCVIAYEFARPSVRLSVCRIQSFNSKTEGRMENQNWRERFARQEKLACHFEFLKVSSQDNRKL